MFPLSGSTIYYPELELKKSQQVKIINPPAVAKVKSLGVCAHF
jgi:hypothetical protein